MNNSQSNFTPPGASGKPNFFTTPLSQRGWPIWAVYLASVLGAIYLLNPGMGVFELIPDNLPIIGNLDEAGAFMLLWFGLMEYFKSRKPKP